MLLGVCVWMCLCECKGPIVRLSLWPKMFTLYVNKMF